VKLLIAALLTLVLFEAPQLRGLKGIALDKAFPQHRRLTPSNLETLEKLTRSCSGPDASEFLGDEARSMAETGHATRTGSVLRVGKAVFRDDPKAADPVEYSYVGVYAKAGLDLVYERGSEDDFYVLVDRNTGKTTAFGGLPRPSPSGRYWASVEEGVNWQGVDIAEQTKSGLRVTQQIAGGYGSHDPCALRWRPDDTFEVDYYDGQVVTNRRHFQRIKSGWDSAPLH
jgi:hypothetical protein